MEKTARTILSERVGTVVPRASGGLVIAGARLDLAPAAHLPSPTEEDRTPVGRPDFKSGEGRWTSLVGSTPTLFRQNLPQRARSFFEHTAPARTRTPTRPPIPEYCRWAAGWGRAPVRFRVSGKRSSRRSPWAARSPGPAGTTAPPAPQSPGWPRYRHTHKRPYTALPSRP